MQLSAKEKEQQANIRLYLIFGWIYDFTKVVTIILLTGLTLHIFIVTVSLVSGSSMEPTLSNNDLVFIDKFTYRRESPQRGDIIIFRFPGEEHTKFVKRVIALPGDTVSMRQGNVFINDAPLTEPYVIPHTSGGEVSYTVQDDEYYVLGDNRIDSFDSRSWGGLPEEYIMGRVMGSATGTRHLLNHWTMRIGEMMRNIISNMNKTFHE